MDIKFAVFVLFIVAVLLTVLLYLGLLGNTVRNAALRLDDIDHNIQSLMSYMSKETYLVTRRIESKIKPSVTAYQIRFRGRRKRNPKSKFDDIEQELTAPKAMPSKVHFNV